MSFIVIDKSWLRGEKSENIISLASNNRFIVPAALGYELFTEKDEVVSTSCFKKLITIQDKIDLIERVGILVKYEIENQKSCTPIEKQFLSSEFKLNPILAKSRFPFNEEHKESIEYFRDFWELSGVQRYKTFSSNVANWIPELQKFRNGCSKEKVKPFLIKVSNDIEFVKQIYDKYRENESLSLPPVVLINEDWAVFRYLQIHLLIGIEYIRKYGSNNMEVISKKFANDNLDIEYCITSTLSKALATRDKGLKNLFELCCKDGKLF